ncbi:diol dehydratase reactivase subunit alpha [Desulfogranum japonicum]|uniref:diol dehydratase reactivase subunit alpha n=1 Tax=Desulfogranum japonicum TaxID=231447 RepID=UPI0003F5617C|nr:diol dehydratase reactivase subunit alpha [Desulfogranum japonicum]
MVLIAGVDIGNNTTEVAVAEVNDRGEATFRGQSLVRTIGIKGTMRNVSGIIDALDQALQPLQIPRKELAGVLLNEATPVIGDVAMETITETVITESAMIGHNPTTPGGMGLGTGITRSIADLGTASTDQEYIVIVSRETNFQLAADLLNQAVNRGVRINGAIVQLDDGVLIHNRLSQPIPIVDEVRYVDRVPVGMFAAVEVASVGRSIEKLSNPYDIATLFNLEADQTRNIVPIARALTGVRSAVVIKTPRGDIQERRIPAGSLTLIGDKATVQVPVDEGAEVIMDKVDEVQPLTEIRAEPGTNVGGMFETVRRVMADLTNQPVGEILVQDIIAVDTLVPQQVQGNLAGEYALGNAVGLAAMVQTQKLPMQMLARKLQEEIQVPVTVAGVEAEMAIHGALTTPGTKAPLAILDLGGGSTDASLIQESGVVRSTHLAGAGDMVTLLIDKELGLDDLDLAERIKFYPLAKVETLFHLRHEDGSVEFFDAPMDPRLFGRVVVMSELGPQPLPVQDPIGRVAEVRRKAKEKVFVRNSLRALAGVAPGGNIRLIDFVTLVGGSSLDFEIPKMISDVLLEYGVVTGRANVRGSQGPRNAVATGLVLTSAGTGYGS